MKFDCNKSGLIISLDVLTSCHSIIFPFHFSCSTLFGEAVKLLERCYRESNKPKLTKVKEPLSLKTLHCIVLYAYKNQKETVLNRYFLGTFSQWGLKQECFTFIFLTTIKIWLNMLCDFSRCLYLKTCVHLFQFENNFLSQLPNKHLFALRFTLDVCVSASPAIWIPV